MDCLQLTISSIKMQEFQKIYHLNIGFEKGTIFEELDKPYLESQGDSCWQAEMNY